MRFVLIYVEIWKYILVMYYDTYDMVVLEIFLCMLMKCYKIIPLQVLKNYLYIFWMKLKM